MATVKSVASFALSLFGSCFTDCWSYCVHILHIGISITKGFPTSEKTAKDTAVRAEQEYLLFLFIYRELHNPPEFRVLPRLVLFLGDFSNVATVFHDDWWTQQHTWRLRLRVRAARCNPLSSARPWHPREREGVKIFWELRVTSICHATVRLIGQGTRLRILASYQHPSRRLGLVPRQERVRGN
ncbi:hypothetical protein EV426DRAFT_252864 [Tirmania nivea]|nr:hypothetical protein EV426DRAFT_252864 [Tirmania nivea]